MTLTSEVIHDASRLEGIKTDWDHLAAKRGRPFSGPAWTLSWGRHLCPAGVDLRVIAVSSGDRLVGVAPFAVEGRSWLSPGGTLAPIEPVVAAGHEDVFAAAVAEAVAAVEPRPLDLWIERHGDSPDWTAALADAWPGGRSPWTWNAGTAPVPVVEFGDGFEAWMEEKSGSFRRDLKRSEKRLAKNGGEFRTATEETLAGDVVDFIRLHRGRLAKDGGSSLDDDRIEAMLVAVGAELLPSDRFRLICLAVDGRTIAAQLLICAGSETSAWNSGFDEAYGRYSPVMQCIVHGLREAAGKGARTMSLGPGDQSYKQRLATRQDSADKSVLVPKESRYAVSRIRIAPLQARRAVATRLSNSTKARVRRLLHR